MRIPFLFLLGLALLLPPSPSPVLAWGQRTGNLGWCPTCGRDMPDGHACRGGGGPKEDGTNGPRIRERTPSEEAFYRAVALRKAGRLEEAVDAYLESLRLDSTDPAAWFNLGNIYWDLGRLSEARESYLRALREKPGYRNAKQNLAALDRKLEAIRFDDLLARYRSLGAAGDYAGAAAAIRAALEIDPKNVLNRIALGWALKMTGDLVGAEAEYRKALKLDPRNADARKDLIEILKFQSSVSSLGKALELDPKDAEVRTRLGSLLLEAGEYGKAETELRRSLALAPADPLARLLLGHALLAQDRVEAGREAIETVLRTGYTGPQAAPAARALGKIYAKEAEALLAEGNADEARRYLSSAAVLDPDTADVRGRLEGLRAEDGALRTERVRKRVSGLSGSWMGAARGAAFEGHAGDTSAVFDTPGMNFGGPAGVDVRGMDPGAFPEIPQEALEDPGIRSLAERRDTARQEAKDLEARAEILRRDPSPKAKAELKTVEPRAEQAIKRVRRISIVLDKAVIDAAKKGKP